MSPSKRNPAARGPGPDVGGAADAAELAAGAERRATGKACRNAAGGARREALEERHSGQSRGLRVMRVATPALLIDTTPSVVVPSMNVTVPGVSVPVPVPIVTVAVKVTC